MIVFVGNEKTKIKLLSFKYSTIVQKQIKFEVKKKKKKKK